MAKKIGKAATKNVIMYESEGRMYPQEEILPPQEFTSTYGGRTSPPPPPPPSIEIHKTIPPTINPREIITPPPVEHRNTIPVNNTTRVQPPPPPVPTFLKDIQFSDELLELPVKIQCTYANCFTEPVWKRGLCIRSYDWKVIKPSKDKIIARLTGNYIIDNKDVIWVEAKLNFTNRRNIGWFRESDIWHAKKGVKEPITPNETVSKKNSSWMTWLTGGITLLSFLR